MQMTRIIAKEIFHNSRYKERTTEKHVGVAEIQHHQD